MGAWFESGGRPDGAALVPLQLQPSPRPRTLPPSAATLQPQPVTMGQPSKRKRDGMWIVAIGAGYSRLVGVAW